MPHCESSKLIFMTQFLLSVTIFNGIEGLSITSLSVPSFIENGTRAYVDLDCVYNFTEEDNYLVVKWYYNDDTSPIYQWIPELSSRRVSDKFQNRIDLSFYNTPSRFTKYRGFRILNPTTELSGKYSCHVTSANGIDDANKLMVIYAPGKVTKFSYSKTSAAIIIFTCEVDLVYPQPHVNLLQEMPGESEPKPLENCLMKTEKYEGSYRIIVTRGIKESEISSHDTTTFKCVISIPQVNVQNHRTITYYPEEGSLSDAPRETDSSNLLLICSVYSLIYYVSLFGDDVTVKFKYCNRL